MNTTLERIYSALPVGLQHIACSAEGLRVTWMRFGGEFDHVLSAAEARSAMSASVVETIRDELFRDFVIDAAATSTFYRNHPAFRAAAAGRSFRADELPILEKRIVQEHASRIARAEVRRARTASTSGSTGMGLRFPVTRQAIWQQWATWWRFRRWHGIQRGEWCGHFGGNPVMPVGRRRGPFWRVNVPGRQVMFSGAHLSADNWRVYVDEIERRRLAWLHGYPSLLALLASFLVEHRQTIATTVRWVTTAAENLLPAQADLIERAFGVRPRQHYGMAEGAANASECPNGRLHVDEDFAFVEFAPVEHGTGYRVLGTNVSNRAFPLIRYDVGDIAQVSGQTCDCGRPGRIIDQIDGRREDYVVLPSGAMVGRLDHIFKDQVRVREGQIYQPDLTRVVLRIACESSFTSRDEQSLVSVARVWLGDDLRIEVERLDALPRTASGKLRFVVSDVIAARLDAPLARI
jgi:phenylacetate-coenzyme A ligase PaaK-like adenylate-forming protein